jgi:hypothetical protein
MSLIDRAMSAYCCISVLVCWERKPETEVRIPVIIE